MTRRRHRKEPVLDSECIVKLRREVEKIPPQTGERAARNLEKLKAEIARLERRPKEDRDRS